MESALSADAAAPELRLIETLGWDGARLVRLPLHLARLAASAARLGWACDARAAKAALLQAVPETPARIRLTLDAKSGIEVQAAALPPAKALWQVGLAAQKLRSDDPWLTLKTSLRPAYDAARAALPKHLDEVILANERGEVCEGSITTVFFDRGQGLRTPPLSCGLLPGVLRAELALPEEILRVEDLADVQLWIGNSLRGLIPARFHPG